MTHQSTATPTTPRGTHASRLAFVLGFTSCYLVAEVVGGLLTRSLALLADAGHMLTDVGGLVLALLAMRFAARPVTPARTYGSYRFEILAALTNCVVLLSISLYILYEAYQRFRHPPAVQSVPMLLIAGVGLVVNLAGVSILRTGAQASLNLQGAYCEVLSDLLTSIGVLVAGVIMLTTGWYYADPLLSAGIGLFILPRTWGLLQQAVGVLLEGTPADVNLTAVRDGIQQVPGVAGVHDLHVWSFTSGVNALSVHVVLERGATHDDVLARVHERVTRDFPIAHATVQVESQGYGAHETHL